MKKEDILKKAQQEKTDEREEEINTKAFRIGWMGVSVVMILLIFLRATFNETATDLVVVLLAQSAAASFYQYFEMRDKKLYLISGIMASIGVILGFASLLSSYGVY